MENEGIQIKGTVEFCPETCQDKVNLVWWLAIDVLASRLAQVACTPTPFPTLCFLLSMWVFFGQKHHHSQYKERPSASSEVGKHFVLKNRGMTAKREAAGRFKFQRTAGCSGQAVPCIRLFTALHVLFFEFRLSFGYEMNPGFPSSFRDEKCCPIRLNRRDPSWRWDQVNGEQSAQNP